MAIYRHRDSQAPFLFSSYLGLKVRLLSMHTFCRVSMSLSLEDPCLDLTLHMALLLTSWSSMRFAGELHTHTLMHTRFEEDAKTLVTSSNHHQVHAVTIVPLQLLSLILPLILATPISPAVTPVPPKWLGLRPPGAPGADTTAHRAPWSDSRCWHQIHSHRSHQQLAISPHSP